MDKLVIREMLRPAALGSLAVTYWDGTTDCFGEDVPKCRIIFNNQLDLKALMSDPILALGEAYMEVQVEIEGDISELLEMAYLNRNTFLHKHPLVKRTLSGWRRTNSISVQKKNVQRHYDLGNEFFSLWLDETMSYSCAYFNTPEDTLDQAQLQKIDYILKKLQLHQGETLLDIGCGWGWLIIRAAQQYGVKALGITVSKEQVAESKRRIRENRLEGKVDIELLDYRQLAEQGVAFDKVVSVGMLEHVGKENLSVYLKSVEQLLVPGGLSLLHSITHQKEGPVNAWIEKHIFPGGYIPSLRELIWLLPEHNFHLLDVESLRLHYALTLEQWAERFENNLDKVREMFDERFVRMWRLYLKACAVSFRYSGLNIHQLLFSKGLNNTLTLTRKHLY